MADENPLLVGNRALSRTGHAAMAMKGTDNEWINIQMNTFNNWVNEQLREADLYVEGLGDFCDGVILCALVEILQGKPIGKVIKNPTNHHQMLHNATLAFNAIASDVKLVNIGPEDVIAGNGKLILGLIWQLILHYQIGKTKFPPKKLMMAWLQAVIPDCNVTNFTRDWNNGVALHGLIDYCKPGLSPEWKNLDRNKGLENCRSGMALAKKHFNIPLVLRPEDLSSRELDELSGMTYLSYYMKQDSPGYHATLNWVKDVSHENVKDFTTDWDDGRVLSKLVTTLGGDLPPLTGSNVERIQTAMDAGRLLGVEPLLTAREMADVEDEHLGIMAYAASFGHLQPVKRAADCVKLSGNFNNVHVASESNFNLKILDDAPNHSDLRVQIKGPSGPVTEHLIWHGKAVKGRFTPTEPGMHEINVFWKNQLISDCPVSFPTVVDVSKILQEHPDQMVVGNVDEIKLDASQVSEGGLIVEATSPSGRIYDLPLTNHAKGQFVAKFLPQEPGDWSVNVMCNHELIPGSPFKVKVIDPSAVTVNGLSRGAVTIPCTFNVDCSKAGEADLKVDITHNENYVPSTVSDNGGRVYSVTFTPPMAGDYNVNVTYGNNTVKGSPFSLDVVDFNMVRIETAGMKLVPVDKPQTFFVDTSNAGGGNVNCTISADLFASFSIELNDLVSRKTRCRNNRVQTMSPYNSDDGGLTDQLYSVEYIPLYPGEHTISMPDARVDGIPSHPYQVKVYDSGRVIVHDMPRIVNLGQMAFFEVDASETGAGNLEIVVNDGRVPCTLESIEKKKFIASFMPENRQPHTIQMKFNGAPVAGSPWHVDVADNYNSDVIDSPRVKRVSKRGLKHAPMHKTVSFLIETDNINANDLDVVIKAPSGREVPCQLYPEKTGYRVEYTPTEVGTYSVHVFFAGSPVSGAPLTMKTYDSKSIDVTQVPNGVVGKPIEFYIDVMKAGEGQLEIMVNNGSLPNAVTQQRPGIYKVSFIPEEAGTHYVDIRFNSERLPGAPYTCQVIDTARVNLEVHRMLVPAQQSSHFVIQSQNILSSGLDPSSMACVVEITGNHNESIPVNLVRLNKFALSASFNPMSVGAYVVRVWVLGHELPQSPLTIHCYDASAVTISHTKDYYILSQPIHIDVDASTAGKGLITAVAVNLDGSVQECKTRHTRDGLYNVELCPLSPGCYCMDIMFNDSFIPGSPLVITVVDPDSVTLTHDLAKPIARNSLSTFTIDSTNDQIATSCINISIIGPDGQDVPVRVKDIMDGVSISWLPRAVGDHTVNVDFAGYPIKGSPFKVKVYDPSSVGVSHVKRAKLGKPVNFELDIGNAGAGNLEIAVGVDGINVPHNVQKLDATRFELSFLPEVSKVHDVSVRFNGDHVPGSPFPCKVIDASQVGVKGDGVTSTPANHIASFMITPQNRGPLQDCTVHVTSPSGHPLPVRLSHVGNGYKAEYTPKQVGEHQILVTYDDTEIPGNPFVCHVYDPEQVHVSRQEKAYLGKPMHVQVDTSVAGSGVLESEVMCRGNLVDSDLSDLGHGRYELSFTPLEQLPHVATITYNGDVICGGPFHIDVYDSDKVTAHGPGLKLAELYKPTYFDVDPHGPIDDNVKVTITTPSGNVLYNHVTPHAHRHRVSFTPDELGPHDIQVTYGDMPIQGSPFTLETFDPNSIYIRDVDKTGRKEREVGFVVDARDAGPGDLDVSVSLKGRKIPLEKEDLVDGQTRYMFTPIQAGVYDADVAFNDTSIPGAPIHIEIQEEVRPSMIRLNSRPNFPYERNGNNWFVVEFGGRNIDFRDILINVTAPNGAKIPCDIVPQSDGDYRVQWTPTIPGRYTIDVLFGERQIQGSPFYVDVFDISKIRIGRVNCSMVGETATFDIDFCDAGKAEYALQIIGPAGMGSIPHNIEEKEDGLRVTFNPTEPGRYKIYVTYGGLEVPDCPIIIDVEDGGMPTTYGDGLVKGEEDKLATFFVDAHNLRGELAVQVEGPNSIAKCTIEERSKGTFAVSYVPVEVGLYNVIVKWNGKEIPGSPFHPSIVDARKVRVVGGWQHYMDNNDKVHLVVNEEKRIPFDVGDAGPGQLSARVVGPNGTLVPVHIDHSSDKATVTFTARQEGTHQIHTHWCDHPLVDSPFIGHARISGKHSPDHTKVILSGRGLKEAIAHEKAEFHIDGSEAGPGKPDVRLEGVKRSIDARLEPLGGGKYRCEYIATVVGAYLLHITWNGRTLRGSPFKVNVLHAQNPQRIQVTGEGLRGGMIGKDINVMIDTRNAGKGELSAHCMGPNVVANCTLTDMRDGTYKLSIHPQESGRHTLHIKYAGEHVFGSPYVLMIYAQPDASKVRVSGPGVEHGILAKFESKFIVETRGAGAGQLTVRIKGPKGAFQVEMTRDSQKDRTIACQYTPMETGLYIIHIRWSGVDVPGSPFYTYIVDSQNELEKVLNDEKYNGIMNNSGYM